MYEVTRSTRSERVRMNVYVRQQNGTGEIGQHFACAPRAVLGVAGYGTNTQHWYDDRFGIQPNPSCDVGKR
jgi:hypothetical protein